MSTRAEREKLGSKYRDLSKLLLKVPGNETCADCGQRDARWCSINLGCFICTQCSGFHRGLGVHLSKVRSVDLDFLTQENYEVLQQWGNIKANWYWEGRGNCSTRESSDSFIRAKYEFKRFARDGPVPNPADIPVGSSNTSYSNPTFNLLDFENMNIRDTPQDVKKKLLPVNNTFASFDAFSSNPSKPADKMQSTDILGLFDSTATKSTDLNGKTIAAKSSKSTLINSEVDSPKPNIGFDFFQKIQPEKQPTIQKNQSNVSNAPLQETEQATSEKSVDLFSFNSPVKTESVHSQQGISQPAPVEHSNFPTKQQQKIEETSEFGSFGSYSSQPSAVVTSPSKSTVPVESFNEWHPEPVSPIKQVKSPKKKTEFVPDFQDNPWG
eukprot:NODE_102_length_20354_cov_0.272018.p4 type:complete len:382 gc:universal NODE_102_length_20354_cov_0.272018:11632-10487(-)